MIWLSLHNKSKYSHALILPGCGLQLCGSCNLCWVLRHSVQHSVLHNSIGVRHIKNIQDHRGGECRINLSNQVYICSMVQNAIGNALEKGTVDICATSLVMAITVNIAKNGINDTLSGCHALYITRTHFSCRFRIWSQKSNMGSVSSAMGWFVLNGSLYGWFTHGKFSNHRYHKSHCQSVVLYI